MERRPTIVFTGGGTGGHLFPGVAVADELHSRDPLTKIIFAGSERAIERDIIGAHGFEHWPLPVEPSTSFKRRPDRSARHLWRSYSIARRKLRECNPDCVVGLGGFASVPVALAARRSRIPLLLLEQNIVPGRATRLLSHFASRVCLSFAETTGPVGRRQNACVTGNPVRAEITEMASAEPALGRESPPTLLVLGGSQGATGVNEAVLEAIIRSGPVLVLLSSWHIVHQTGQRDASGFRQMYEGLGLNAVVEPFFPDLASWYRRASLVVSRAGATTLAELACVGSPALLIPYPNSIGDHQLANARWYAERKAAVVIEHQKDRVATARRLGEELLPLLVDSGRRQAMREEMRTLARPGAAREVAECIRRFLR